MATLPDLVQHIETQRAALYQPKRSRQDYPRASSIGNCAREVYYQITAADQRPSPDLALLQRFARGGEVHSIVQRELLTAGVRFVHAERPFEITGGDGIIICTGHIDGRIEYNVESCVCEIKSLTPNVWSRIDRIEDFWRMGSFWAKYPRQLLLYLHATGERYGMMILDDCLGHWKLLPMDAREFIDETREALAICEAAARAVKAGEAPGFISDSSECFSCWARAAGVCFPPLEYEQMGGVLEDAELEAALQRMEELKPLAQEYGELDADLKTAQKARGAGRYVCGAYDIETKVGTMARYDVPKEVKEPYKTETTRVVTTWRRRDGQPLTTG